MDDVKWTRIKGNRTWHIIENRINTLGGQSWYRTLCGLEEPVTAGGAHDTRPGNQPSCENCLAIAGPK